MIWEERNDSFCPCCVFKILELFKIVSHTKCNNNKIIIKSQQEPTKCWVWIELYWCINFSRWLVGWIVCCLMVWYQKILCFLSSKLWLYGSISNFLYFINPPSTIIILKNHHHQLYYHYYYRLWWNVFSGWFKFNIYVVVIKLK